MNHNISFLGRRWEPKFQTDSMNDLREKMTSERQEFLPDDIFFNPTHKDLLDHWEMKDLKKAVDRIALAIEKKERIMVHGDFDADGVTSTVILVDGLKKLGAQVSYRIPSREKDSHGLKIPMIEEIAKTGSALMITCDCGINDGIEVEHAVALGIDVIITDHHHPREEDFPVQALAVVNPHQTDCLYGEKNLSGAGVVFKIVMGLYERILGEKPPEKWMDRYLEIAAIGQVADCMPLKGEIRTMTSLGLKALEKSDWECLRYLSREENFEEITTETIGFSIAPKVNAASRVGEVIHAVQFFLSEKGFKEKLEHLNYLNEYRKILTQEALLEAENKIDTSTEVLWVHLPDVKTGILGLVASKFVEKYQKPAILSNEASDFIHASVRAPEGCDLMKILDPVKELFDRYGGHKGAAGFRLNKNKEEVLLKEIKNLKSFKSKDLILQIEDFVDSENLDLNCLDFHQKIAPFGRKNENPKYGIKNIKFEEINLMGKDKNHLRITFKKENKYQVLVGFFMGHWVENLDLKKNYDCVVEVSKNSWNGNISAQLRLIDIRESI